MKRPVSSVEVKKRLVKSEFIVCLALVGLQGFEPWILPGKSRMFWTAKLKTLQLAWASSGRLPKPRVVP